MLLQNLLEITMHYWAWLLGAAGSLSLLLPRLGFITSAARLMSGAIPLSAGLSVLAPGASIWSSLSWILKPLGILATALLLTWSAYQWGQWGREAAVTAAYHKGYATGGEEVASKVNESAAKTVESVKTGEAEMVVIPPEKARLIELCQRSASCREHKK